MTVKYSPKMLRELRKLHASTCSDAEGEGVKGSYWINANTAVALLNRGAITNITSTRIGITRTGAEVIDVDYDALIGRAHERALIDDANLRRCPFRLDGCDFVAFGSPGTPFGHYKNITSEDQILWHVGMSHMSLHSFPSLSIIRMTDEHRAMVREFVDAYEQAKAYVAPADDESTGEARERRERLAERDHEEQMHSVPPKVVCINSQTHAAHRIAGTPRTWCPGYTEPVKAPTYAVDIPLQGVEHCANDHAHHPHVWSHLGPEPTWYCDGTFQYVPESQALPELHGPIVDDHGDDVAVGPIARHVIAQALTALDDVDAGGRPVVLKSNLDGWQSGMFTHFALDSQS